MIAEHVTAFLAAMEAAGIKPIDPIAPALGSTLIRFRCDGDGPGKRNGWAVLHLDGRPAGAFGNYRLGISQTWRGGSLDPLAPADRRQQAQRIREAQASRADAMREQHEATARLCQDRMARSTPVDPAHPYLMRKGIAGEALRGEGRYLLVPMRDAGGALWNVQTIDSKGVKRFAKGRRQQGLHMLMGEPSSTVAVAEGYATAAVIRRATGMAVAVAFSAANLTATARAMRDRFPATDIVIGADDDAHLINHPTIKRNIGLDAAHAAAQAVGGRVAVPPRHAA